MAELTRFMDRDADEASWPSRRAGAGRTGGPPAGEAEDAGDMPVRRPVRRQPSLDLPPSYEDEDEGAEAMSSGDAFASESQRDALVDDDMRVSEEDPAEAADGTAADVSSDEDDVPEDVASEEDVPEAADEGAADAEDPFMQALMQELESDSAPVQDAAPAPKVRPSFAFPAARPQAGSPEEASSPVVGRPGATAASEPAHPSDAPVERASAPLPAWRASPPAAPVIRSRATPVAPPPVQATMPTPATRDAERLEHARDHEAISSEADGALEELRSRLKRGSQPGAPEAQGSAAGETPSPSPPRSATSWARPSSPPTPAAGAQPAPASSREVPERPSFVRAAPAVGSTGQGRSGWAPHTEPAAAPERAEPAFDEDLSDDGEIDDEGTVERGFEDTDRDGESDTGHDAERGDAVAAEPGWTLDEDELANAIARSVGGIDEHDADEGVEDDAGYEEALAADQDGGLFDDGGDTIYEDDASAIDDIDFEFELMSTAPDATADDFRKPSERSASEDAPEPFELAPFDSTADEAADVEVFAQAPWQPAEMDGNEGVEDEAAAEADDHDDADAAVIEDDPTESVEDGGDEEPSRVFPELASRGRRAVPNFRFDLKGADHPAQTDAEAPAKPRDLDFDLPGFGSSDSWAAWPAGPKQAAKIGPAATTDSGSTVAEQLADALFGDQAAPAELPRVLGKRPALERSDWSSGPLSSEPEPADGISDDYVEGDEAYAEYDDAYYDEAEPEWEDESHSLSPHSLGEMDAALGLSGRRPRRKIGRPLAALVLLLLVAGGGYAAYSLLSGAEETTDGPPPVIQANADGVKVMADGADQADGGKTVYDRVGEDPSENGRLVRSQEVPIDPSQSAGADNPISSPLLPKRVRTVVVRPDGTIIPADELDAAQGQTDALVAPSTPSSATGDPAADVATSPAPIADSAPETAEAVQPEPASTQEEAEASLPGVNVPADEDAALAETSEPASAPALSPIRTSERIAAQPSPAPAPRPAASGDTRTVSTSRVTTPAATQQRGPLSLVPDAPGAETAATTTSPTLPSPSRSATQQPVGDRVSPAVLAAQNQRANQPQNTQTAAAAPAATSAPAPAGDWAVQVSSQRTADQARAAYQQLQSRFPGVLGGREPSIQAADLGDRGTFYRVRLPAQTRDAANQICADLKAAGGDCFVGRN
ncbi:SPOR domain-containing protein [Amorphus sp. MBR-141]